MKRAGAWRLWLGGGVDDFPVAREQLGPPAIGVGGDPLEHVAQVGPRIDAVGLARRHDAVENRGALAASVAATEEPVLSASDDPSEGALRDIVVDGEGAVLAVACQRRPLRPRTCSVTNRDAG
jgi:hypothetical protein